MQPFWLIILGILTYFIVRRSLAGVNWPPVWLLWLVLMMPVFIWSLWTAKHGYKPPLIVVISTLAVSCIIYWLLFRWGQHKSKNKDPNILDKPEVQSIINPALRSLPLSSSLQEDEERKLRSCFSFSVYFLQNIEYLPQAIVCQGQLKTNSSKAYQHIKHNIDSQFNDRFILIFQEGFNGKPLFILIPNSKVNKKSNASKEQLTRPGLALVLLGTTFITTTGIGAKIAGLEMETLTANPQELLQGLPYALGLMSILGIHELGHYFAARLYKMRTTLPYFIPIPVFLGTLGAFIQMRSLIPNRKALFDISIAGPIAGFILTLPLLLWGLAHSQVVPLPEEPKGFLDPNALNPKYSFLLAIAAKLVLGNKLTAQSAIDLHPLGIAACLGLIVTALNLIPMGQLDGGHIVHAMFGQKSAMFISQVSRLLCLLLSLVQPGVFLWAIILFFMPLIDEPALNDVTELDNKRDTLGLVMIALLISILLPIPKTIANFLQI
ncbi:Zinc metalloprotease [Richelia intracellularis HH01]|uniref:Zinc metalloprotease n=1 Tax=Richelia intracellularis HH01 TaxID=1165094 RepID=M1WYY1_9NOST|nr:site-2 protease family protein [Richelia intracellularis]CCH66308.1 Zinc metalloprotease [Richelia intracellularis HH01]